MSRLWSPAVHRLRPYVPGEQPKDRVFIKLNTNENPYGPSPAAIAAMRAAAGDGLRLYPDPAASDLCAAIAAPLGLDPGNVFVGNGSDEVLAHAFSAFFCGRGDLLFADVTYSFYRTWCDLYDIPVRLVPLAGDFTCDPGLYRGPGAGVVIANPNAPTGIALPLSAIEALLVAHPDRVVLVDEAYVDFGGESAAGLIARHDNLLVVQTFSKSRSLAGLRVGFALGQVALIEGLQRVKDSFNSYPLGRIALAGAQAAWEDRDWFDRTRGQVMADRDRLAGELARMGFRVLPSAANFLFVSHGQVAAPVLLAALRDRGILVRHFGQARIADWLRISIGTRAECAALVAALGDILADIPGGAGQAT